MIEQKQLYRHKPTEGSYGDCWRTCLACILDRNPETIPHYYSTLWDEGKNIAPLVHQLTNKFFLEADWGVQFVEFPVECEYEQLRVYISHYFKDIIDGL